MERMLQIVNEARRKNEQLLNQMVDDYIEKASMVLKDFLKWPGNTGYKYVAVEVADIDYEEGNVIVGTILRVVSPFTPYTDEDLANAEDFSEEVLVSKFFPEEVKPFVEQLKKKGFKYLVYKKELYNERRGLYPFIEI